MLEKRRIELVNQGALEHSCSSPVNRQGRATSFKNRRPPAITLHVECFERLAAHLPKCAHVFTAVLAIWDIGSQNQGFSEKQEGSKSSGVALF